MIKDRSSSDECGFPESLSLSPSPECEVIAPDSGQAGVRTRLDMSAAAVFAEKMNQSSAARSKVSCYIAPR